MCYIQHSRWRCPRCGEKSGEDTVELINCAMGLHEPTWVNSTGRTSLSDCEQCLANPVNAGPPIVIADHESWLSDPMNYEQPAYDSSPEPTSAGPGVVIYAPWHGLGDRGTVGSDNVAASTAHQSKPATVDASTQCDISVGEDESEVSTEQEDRVLRKTKPEDTKGFDSTENDAPLRVSTFLTNKDDDCAS